MITTATIAEDLVRPVATDIRRLAAQAEAERRLPEALLDAITQPEALRVTEEVSRHDGSTGWTISLGIANSVFTGPVSGGRGPRAWRRLAPDRQRAGVRWTRVEGGGRIPHHGSMAVQQRCPERHLDRHRRSRLRWRRAACRADWARDDLRLSAAVRRVNHRHLARHRPAGDRHSRPRSRRRLRPGRDGGRFLAAGGAAAGARVRARRGVFLYAARDRTVADRLPRPGAARYRGVQAACPHQGERLRSAPEREGSGTGGTGASRGIGAIGPQLLVRACGGNLGCRRAGEPDDTARAHLRPPRVADGGRNSVAAIDLLYRLGGTSTIFQASPIERCWRDVHTAAQHMQVQDSCWQTASRILLGINQTIR